MDSILCTHCHRSLTLKEALSGKCPVCGALLPGSAPAPTPPPRSTTAAWLLGGFVLLSIVGVGVWIFSTEIGQEKNTKPLVAKAKDDNPKPNPEAAKSLAAVQPVPPGSSKGPPRDNSAVARSKPDDKVIVKPPKVVEELAAIDLEQLRTQRTLRELDLEKTKVTAHDLEQLKGLGELRNLSLKGTRIAGPGLEHLRGLNRVDLSNTPITDAGLAHLKGLGELREVVLQGTRITGPGLANLSGVTSLDLSQTPFADAGMTHLRRLSQLRVLILRGTKVTGPGLEKLAGLSRLDLRDTPITDRGLIYLRRLTELRDLDLTGTKVSDKAVDSLQRLRPDLRITR